MLIANGVVFVLQYIFGPQMNHLFGLTPARFFSEFPNLIHQPITYIFLHGGFFHLFFNMFVLWMFGTEIEYAWGSKSFAKFYFVAGLIGAALVLAVHSSQVIPTIGASGAIYGVFAAYWIMFPNRYVYLYFLFPVKVKWFVPGMMILGLLFSAGNVAHMAHLGGFLWGVVYLKSDWRLGRFSRFFKSLRHKRQTAKLNKKVQKTEEIMKRVDAVLDKINEVGIENISKADRKFLEEASSELSREKHNETN
jgi:membrane associated rhomboid family serine protease